MSEAINICPLKKFEFLFNFICCKSGTYSLYHHYIDPKSSIIFYKKDYLKNITFILKKQGNKVFNQLKDLKLNNILN